MCGFGDLAECSLVQPAVNGFAIFVPDQFRSSLFVNDFDFLAGRRSDTDRVDHDVLLCQPLGGADTAFFQVFSISHHDQQFSAILFVESCESFFEASANVCSEDRDGFVVHTHESLFKGAVIEREWALEEGVAGKGDETDAAGATAADEVEDGQFGALQTAGADIPGQHAPGTVQDEYHIFAEAFLGDSLLAPLRTRESKANASDGSHQKRILQGAAERTV